VPDLDFSGLRGEIETATRLPEFTAVERRGFRARTRDRLSRLMIAVTTLGVLVPAVLVGLNAAPGQTPATLGRDSTEPYLPVDQQSSPQLATTIYAITGTSRTSMYAAVDVCRPGRAAALCSLQVVALGLTAQDQRNPFAVDELRASPTDPLSDITLSMTSSKSLMLSARKHDGTTTSRRITLGGVATIAGEPPNAGPQRGDRLVQSIRYGDPYYVQQSDDQALRLSGVPPLSNLVVVTSAPVDSGWWLTGVSPVTGEVAVAVSRNQGASWTVTSLGLKPGVGDPVFATADGNTAYVFVRTAGGIRQFRSTDHGQSWQTLDSDLPWPFGEGFRVAEHTIGAVVRTDGSVLLYVVDEPMTVYLESTDLGLSYHAFDGPGGPAVSVGDGFVTVSDPPKVSKDARTWTPLPSPAIRPPTS
jgi:hypothetical protein